MPYASRRELPPAVKALPKHAQEIYKSAFNSAFEEYGEDRAHAIAWSAVKKKYKKEDDRWVAKDENPMEEIITLDAKDIRFTDDGYLVVSPRVARTGIQVYKGYELGDDRPEVRVYRPESTVMDAAAMKTFAHRPITVGHPPEMVNSKNWKKYAVGQTGDEVVRDGNFIRVPMVLMDEDIISRVKSGKVSQLSVGYTSDIDWQDGKTPDGEPYDAVQQSIRANHIALVAQARGGPMLRVGDDDHEDGGPKMKTFTVDGMELQLGETEGAVVTRSFARLNDDLKASADNIARLQKEVEDRTAELAAAKKATETKDGEIAVLKQQVKDAELTADKLDARVNQRLVVAGKARAILGDSFDHTGKSDVDIKRACVAKYLGDAVAKDMCDAALDGAFTTISANLKTPSPTAPNFGTRQLADALQPNVQTQDARDAAWEQRGKDQRDAWKYPQGRPAH